jgi:hypothetical protein
MNTSTKDSTTRTATVRARGAKVGLADGEVYQCFIGTIMPQLECGDLHAEVLHRMEGLR